MVFKFKKAQTRPDGAAERESGTRTPSHSSLTTESPPPYTPTAPSEKSSSNKSTPATQLQTLSSSPEPLLDETKVQRKDIECFLQTIKKDHGGELRSLELERQGVICEHNIEITQLRHQHVLQEHEAWKVSQKLEREGVSFENILEAVRSVYERESRETAPAPGKKKKALKILSTRLTEAERQEIEDLEEGKKNLHVQGIKLIEFKREEQVALCNADIAKLKHQQLLQEFEAQRTFDDLEDEGVPYKEIMETLKTAYERGTRERCKDEE